MSLDQAISPLVAIALIELMVATGLGIRLADVVDAARDWRLLARAGLVNYMAVPFAAVLLLLLLRVEPTAAAGFLILAVCPGAPYAPPLTALAGGNVAVSAGLMMVLAGSSVIVAPFLLSVLLPFTTGSGELRVDALRMLGTILVTQLLPLSSGLAVNYWRPDLAARLLKPAVAVGKILNVAVIGLILLTQARHLVEIRLIGILAMLIWLGISIVLGWTLADHRRQRGGTLGRAQGGSGWLVAGAHARPQAADAGAGGAGQQDGPDRLGADGQGWGYRAPVAAV